MLSLRRRPLLDYLGPRITRLQLHPWWLRAAFSKYRAPLLVLFPALTIGGCAAAAPPDMGTVVGAKHLVLAQQRRIFQEVRAVRNVWIQEGVLDPSGLLQVCLVSDDMNLAGVFTGATMKVLVFNPSGRLVLRRSPRFTDPCDSKLMLPFPELNVAPDLYIPRLLDNRFP